MGGAVFSGDSEGTVHDTHVRHFRSSFAFRVCAGALLGAFTAIAYAQGLHQADTDGVMQFSKAAEDYAFLHRQLERRLPPMEVNANPQTIRHAIDEMAAAVRAARPDAQPDDLFNPAVQAAIRLRIAKSLDSHGFTPADVREAELVEGIDAASVTLRVNGTFPWTLGTAMFPCVIEALPPLPPELQYRLLGRDLFLIDVHASLIVDILPLALGDTSITFWPTAY